MQVQFLKWGKNLGYTLKSVITAKLLLIVLHLPHKWFENHKKEFESIF